MMILLTVGLFCAAARAQSPLTAFAGLSPVVGSLNYEGRFVPGGDRDPELTETRLSLVVPAYRDSGRTVTPALTSGRLSLNKSVALSTGREVPRQLSRLEVGAQYARQLERGRTWSARAAVGYAGDRPFAANEDLTFSFAGTYGYPGRRGTGC